VDALNLLALEVRLALFDGLAHGRLGRRALLDDSRLERKVEVGRVLVRRVDPPVADQEALEVGRHALGRQDGVGDVGDVLAGVRLAGEVGLCASRRRRSALVRFGREGESGRGRTSWFTNSG